MRMLRDHDLSAALVEGGDDVVAVEGLVGDQRARLDAVDERRDADSIEALSWQQDESDEVAERAVRARILVVMPPSERPMAWL